MKDGIDQQVKCGHILEVTALRDAFIGAVERADRRWIFLLHIVHGLTVIIEPERQLSVITLCKVDRAVTVAVHAQAHVNHGVRRGISGGVAGPRESGICHRAKYH